MAHDYDVIFFGAGPASTLAAALVLRTHPKRRVLIVERETMPRPHVGETALPNWAPILARAGILESLVRTVPIRKVGVLFAWGPERAGEHWTADFREPDGRAPTAAWHVDRGSFDATLLEHAQKLGADVRIGSTVTRVMAIPRHGQDPLSEDATIEEMRVELTSASGVTEHVTAGHVVDGTGQSRLLAQLWNIPLRRQHEMNNYAVYGYWRGSAIHRAEGWPLADDERWAVIGTCDLGWIWHIPIGPDLVSVGLVTHRDTLREHAGRDLRALFDEARTTWGPRHLLEGATCIGGLPDGSAAERLSVVSDWAYVTERIAGPGWFMAGDAAMFVDPILSSGLVLAAQAAMMVANALETVWDDPAVDEAKLRASFTRRYTSLGDTFHRMARAWYARNARSESWHWQAQRERLRAGGHAIYEKSADALTAISMGTVVDPLESAAAHAEPGVASTFRWVVAQRLFASDGADDPWDGIDDTTRARATMRTKLRARWERLARSHLSLRHASMHTHEGYHTHERTTRWLPLTYVELSVESTETIQLAFPHVDGRTLRVLEALDGSSATIDVITSAIEGLPVGSPSRTDATVALCEMIAQLDMLDTLDTARVRDASPLQGHPFVSVLLESAVRAARGPVKISAELDWLGEQCRLWVVTEGEPRQYTLARASSVDRSRFQSFGRTTAIAQVGSVDAAGRAFADGLTRRLDTHVAPRAAMLWDECRQIPATSLRIERDADGRVTLSRDPSAAR